MKLIANARGRWSVHSWVFRAIRIVTADYWYQRDRRGTLFVLMFHQVRDRRTRFYPAVPVAAFAEMCAFLKRHLPVLTFSQVGAHFSKSGGPAAIITFDDGHADFKEHAWPILRSHGLPANVNIDTEVLETGLPQDNIRIYDVLNATSETCYVNRAFFPEPVDLSGGNPYAVERRFSEIMSGLPPEKRRQLSDDVRARLAPPGFTHSRVLRREDVRRLSEEGVEIGSHTHTHAVLTSLDDEAIEVELAKSRRILSDLCGRSIDVLAYPNGVADARVDRIARGVGYKFLLRTGDRPTVLGSPPSDTYSRLNVYHETSEEGLAQVFGVYSMIRHLRNMIRVGRRL